MWFSFWRSRDRFSIDELRYLTEQLQKVQIVNEVNQDFVIEALRSIAELITYGDQHDSNFFEFFMEKQVMGELVRMLAISKTISVSLQLLQTMSIMIQNLKSEHAIYYMFSNEHVNYLITYTFDFRNEELLSYYISFLRAISGKLNKNTISLLVKTEHEEVVSFPLYVEAIRFAFHEENMVRTAVRVVTLNVYHVGDEYVNRFVTKVPHADYFSNLVTFFRKQCVDLNRFVYETLKSPSPDLSEAVISAVDDIEDNLYYISDVISAGIPDVAKLITDKILRLLILPLLLPSLRFGVVNEKQIGAMTSLYLLCCILRIVKIKDLANIIAAALFCPSEAFIVGSEAKLNGYAYDHCSVLENQQLEIGKGDDCVRVAMLKLSDSSQVDTGGITESSSCCLPHHTLRHDLLLYLTSGNDLHVLGSLSLLATLLQTKELDETMLDALGILPQRKQHKKLLLEHYGVDSYSTEVDSSPRVHRFQVLDALVSLFCRSNISAETFWVGGWLLRQLVPYNKEEFNYHHLELLRDSYKNCTTALIEEIRGSWPDLLIKVLCDEWKKCKRAIEAASPHKEPKCILLPLQGSPYDDVLPNESSFVAGEKMWELAKVFVLLHQLQIFSLGRAYLEQPPHPATDVPENSRAKTAGLDTSGPKSGTEVNLVDAVPCRIAFERGKERHFYFLAVSLGTSGWLLLAEELPLKQHRGVVRLTAPLAGSKPKIDDKHSKWLHLRIRPSTLPFVDSAKSIPSGRTKGKALVDGRWTLAFRDEEACKSALSMILVEINRQCSEVERRLKPLLDLEGAGDATSPFLHPSTPSSSNVTPSNLV
ncbi:hypothetical protein K2173_016436 [Erythroxylum novogranatense]|uniref:FPL domain-containing protein n=1 Tax=Erythroxylum novogranatense TaxID=1862640 RepID=A0AAV8SGD7_9ROSI|nr:hypothetical protein K2173_016436 [Erythroxylum novogranatense]